MKQSSFFMAGLVLSSIPVIARWYRKGWQLLESHTFTPIWLPRRCRHPLVGYIIAIFLVVAFALLEVLLKNVLPTLEPLSIVEFAPVALVSFAWGIGPGIVATALSAILIDNFIHAAGSQWTFTISAMTATVLFVAIGLFISGCICRLEHVYQRATRLANELALERVRLETIVSSAPNGIIVYDTSGYITRLNPAGMKLFGTEYRHAALATITGFYQIRTKDQQLLTPDALPIVHALRGEVVDAIEVQMCDAEGNMLIVCIHAAPIIDAQRTLAGCVALFHDMTKLRQAEHEANRRMDEFLGLVSHELRTPLTTIEVSIELAQRQLVQLLKRPLEDMKDEIRTKLITLHKTLNAAEHQLDRQNRLVNDLLTISQIQANRFIMKPQLCDLLTIVNDAVVDMQALAPTRQIHWTPPADKVEVYVDADRVSQVIINYLSNALKYTRQEKPITVSLSVENTIARVAVHDEGPGLSAEQQQNLWQRFYRAPGIEVQQSSHIGLGLGLYICRTIIHQHGGEVGVESQPGQGATFWFTLPVHPAPDGPSPH